MKINNKITGIVLAGGKSSRMGKEKGLCVFRGKPLIEYSTGILKNICDEVIISANNDSYDYLGLPVVNDKFQNSGPVAGLVAALNHSSTIDNFVLSCDIPFVTVNIVEFILSNKDGFDAVVPLNNGFPEPLCAYYNKKAATVFANALNNGIYKLQKTIINLKTNFIDIDSKLWENGNNPFTNINTMNDIKKFSRNF